MNSTNQMRSERTVYLAEQNVSVLAYTAGVIDGDGSISISREGGRKGTRNYTLSIWVANTDRRLLDWLRSVYGGSVSNPQKRSQYRKPMYQYHLTGWRVATLLGLLLPYLKLKHPQAELALQFQSRKLRYGLDRTADEELILDEADHQTMHAYNKRGEQ
jgi:hypothetical protein